MTDFEINTTEDKNEQELAAMADKCARLKATKDAAEKAFKRAKSEFETICDEQGIKEIVTSEVKVTIKKSQRFKQYRDEKAVKEMIPSKYVEDVVSLDRKKINGLIDAGVLPQEIKDEEMATTTVTTTFKAV